MVRAARQEAGRPAPEKKEGRIKKIAAVLFSLVALGTAIENFRGAQPANPDADGDDHTSETTGADNERARGGKDLQRDLEAAIGEITPEQRQKLREGIHAIDEQLREAPEIKQKHAELRRHMLDIAQDFLAHIRREEIVEATPMFGFTPEAEEQSRQELEEYLERVSFKESGETIELLVEGNPIVSFEFITNNADGTADIHIKEFGAGGWDQRPGIDPPGMTWMMNGDFEGWWSSQGKKMILGLIDSDRLAEKEQ